MNFGSCSRISFVIMVFASGVARADTIGLPPNMDFEREWKSDVTSLEGTQLLAIRTAEQWAALWKKHAPKDKEPPAVDFDRWMVVGIATPAPKDPHQIYRIELDNAAKPKSLQIRVATYGVSFRPKHVEIKGVKIHLVLTGKSALPVEFIEDAQVDAGAGWITDYVDQKALGKVAGIKPLAGAGRAGYREDAEQLIAATLTPAEIVKLRTQMRSRTSSGKRYPELWSVIDVRRDEKSWEINYDGLRFAVDVQTGQVIRPEWKLKVPPRPGSL